MPLKYQKNFKGDANTNSANDVGSFNKVFIDFSGGPILMLVGFVIILMSAAIIYMIVAHAILVIIVVVAGFVLITSVGTGVIVAVLVSHGVRHVSGTRAQLAHDREQEKWSRDVYPVGGHIVVRNPHTRELSVHNARDVVENRHYEQRQGALPVQTDDFNMPSLYDLAGGENT